MTTREEQEQYKWKGMQDGKVEELIHHERRANQRKMLQKMSTIKKDGASADDKEEDESEQEMLEEGPSDTESIQIRQD